MLQQNSGLEPGRVLLGRFEVRALLAEGGMGAVYLARHVGLDMAVAIKVLREPLDAESADKSQLRFIHEARALARIHSEYVCRPLDFGTLETGEPYLVLEYLEGCSLSDYARERQLSLADVVDVVLQAAAGLAEAHRLGLVHRDVKPSNIRMNSETGRRWVAKLVDFGLSKSAGVSASITGGDRVVGTPKFMSPEQIRREPIDHRTDVWSLGVVLFWLLTKSYPFTGPSTAGIFANILDHPHTPLSKLRPDLPEDLARTIDACLEKNPVDRMPWMGALAARLAPYGSLAGAVAAETARASVKASSATLDVPMRAAAPVIATRPEIEDAPPTIGSGPPDFAAVESANSSDSPPAKLGGSVELTKPSPGVAKTAEMLTPSSPAPIPVAKPDDAKKPPAPVEFATPKRR